MAGPPGTPPGWHPIELSLPVPGSTNPYQFNAQSQQDLRPAMQGYRQEVMGGVRQMAGLPPKPAIDHPLPPVQQGGGPGGFGGNPMLQQFFDHIMQQHSGGPNTQHPLNPGTQPTGQHPLNPGASGGLHPLIHQILPYIRSFAQTVGPGPAQQWLAHLLEQLHGQQGQPTPMPQPMPPVQKPGL